MLSDARMTEAYMKLIDQKRVRWQSRAHFFGIAIEETAEVIGVSVPTINRQWRMAKAWLYSQIAN